MKSVYDSLIIKHCVECGAPVRYRKTIPDDQVHCPNCKQDKNNKIRNSKYDYDKAMASKLRCKNHICYLAERIGCTLRGPRKKYYIVLTATTLLTYENRVPVYIESPGREFMRPLHFAPGVTCEDLARAWGVKI